MVQKKLDPSVEYAIREAMSNIFELNEGNSISIRVSSDSSSIVSNVVSDVHDNSLESYLIGEMSKGMGDDEEPKTLLEIKKHSILTSVNGKDNQSDVIMTNSKMTQSITKILEGLKFKSPKRARRKTKN